MHSFCFAFDHQIFQEEVKVTWAFLMLVKLYEVSVDVR